MAGGSIEYVPNNGAFIWRNVTTNRVKEGSLAGCVRPDGYLTIGGQRAHRLAFQLMGVELPEDAVVDHINGDTLDNRWVNLRIANRKINAHNTGLRSTNKTGKRGVSWDAARNKYRAALVVDGRQVSKRFESLVEAEEWYDSQATLAGVKEYQRPLAYPSTSVA